MNVNCPSCGAEMSLDVLLAHEESRAAMAALCQMSLPLPGLTLRYITMFRPAKRQMSHSRTVALLSELLPDMQRGSITRNGRDWAAPLALWRAGFERMLEARDGGKLTLPLKSHGYLHEVMVGLADKAEGAQERETEQARRGRTAMEGAQPIAQLLAEPAPKPPVLAAAAPAGPSRYALRVKAQNEARLRELAGGSTGHDSEQTSAQENA